MAEIAVLLAIKKITIAVTGEILNVVKPFLAKKAELVMALPTNMELIKEELELINAFLNKNGMKNCNDTILEAWIMQVRRLAYDIEDIVDQFIYVVGEHQRERCWDFLKKIIKKPRSLFSLDEIATEVEKVKNKLKELSQRRDRWIHPTDGKLENHVSSFTREQVYGSRYIHSIDEDKLVGIDKNRDMLTKILHSEDRALLTVSVWGMGGIGKSTLVNNVYKREGPKFDCHAWISVSQSYKMDHILREMLRELYAKGNKTSFDAESLNIAELREELNTFLDQKRYLIILDDVWTDTAILEITSLFANQGQQSRLVITTRSEKVASIATDGCKIELKALNWHGARSLFFRKAFQTIENYTCPPELQKLGEEIVDKCEGLPLALVVVGGLLSLIKKDEVGWKRVRDQLSWELRNNPDLRLVEKTLNLSYKHLPYYLKNCFLYCSMFPEDYLIRRKNLIRLWIAEGFVEKRGTSSLEDVAEGYLIELAQRSLLQVEERNTFGRLKRLRMHDLLRELAIFWSKKESFSLIYDETSEVTEMVSDSRRLSVLRCDNDIELSIDPSRLRTFLAFDNNMPPSSWSFFVPPKSKYLAVLDLSGLPIDTIPYSVGELFNLKYLCLNNTNVKSLPKSITKLQNLQVLSLIQTLLLNLPHWLAKLKKLRHLLIWQILDLSGKSFHWYAGAKAFEGLWNLKELQTLENVRVSKDLVVKLGNLTQLRCLCISDVRSSYCTQLCSSLSKMHQLSRLRMSASNENEVIHLEALTSPPPFLRKLQLTARLAKETLESPLFLALGNTLFELELGWCQLTEKTIMPLSKLSNLTVLLISSMAYCGQQLSFQAGWFSNLKELVLCNLPEVNEIYIEEGALVSLETLYIDGLKELRDIPNGVEFLSCVHEAYFLHLHHDFSLNLEESTLTGKLKNIPTIYHW